MTGTDNSHIEETEITQREEEREEVLQPGIISLEELSSRIDDLRLQITQLDSFQKGAITCGQIMTGVLAIILAVLGVTTIFQFINSSIDARVKNRVSEEVTTQVGELEERLHHVDELVTQMEESVRRAEIAAAIAEASIPEPLVSLSDLYTEPEATWTIIIASERNLEDAIEASEIATQKGYTVAIYKVGDYYTATVGRYRYKQEAENNLPEIRAEIEPTAYPINLAYSCPYTKYFEEAGFYGCFLEPPEE